MSIDGSRSSASQRRDRCLGLLVVIQTAASHALWMPMNSSMSAATGDAVKRSCRRSQHKRAGEEKPCVRDERQRGMPDPVLQHRFVSTLSPRLEGYEGRVNDTSHTDRSQTSRQRHRRVIRHRDDRRNQQHGAEMNDRRRPERTQRLRAGGRAHVGTQRDDDELQSRQRGCRRADDHVEVVPIPE